MEHIPRVEGAWACKYYMTFAGHLRLWLNVETERSALENAYLGLVAAVAEIDRKTLSIRV